jgi:hypothetical protein
MRKLVSLLFVFSIAMLFVLAVPRVFAKPGGVKVDNDRDCADPDREENFNPGIDSGYMVDGSPCKANLWVNLSTNHYCGGPLACTISCSNGNFLPEEECSLREEYPCSGKYQDWTVYNFTVPFSDTVVVCTITVVDKNCPSSNQVISRDSWRQDDSAVAACD